VLSVSATQYVGWGWSSCDVCGGIVFLSDIQYFNVSIFDPSTNCFLAGYHQLPTARSFLPNGCHHSVLPFPCKHKCTRKTPQDFGVDGTVFNRRKITHLRDFTSCRSDECNPLIGQIMTMQVIEATSYCVVNAL